MMKGAWGNKWSDEIATDLDFECKVKAWGESLFHLTGKEIAIAFDKCKVTYDWPPSVSEFIESVKPKVVNAKMYQEFAPEKLLDSDEVKEKRKKAANKALSDIRKIMKR